MPPSGLTTNKMNLYKLAELYDRSGDLSKRWFVGYYYVHPETGKLQLQQIWISSKLRTKHARRVKANTIIENINNKLHQGFNPYQNENIGYTSVVNAIVRILEYKQTYIRQRSFFTIRSYIKIFSDWLSKTNFSNIAIESFNFQHAIQFSDYLKINRKLANRSHNNYIKGLRTIFNELVEREYMIKNPFSKVKILPFEKRNIFAYSENEIKILKDYCLKNDKRLWLVCQFEFYCAIRPAEMVKCKN